MARRATWAGVILSALLVIAVTSLVIASRNSVSATQAAANATPPPPGPTSAEVEERPLAETLSVRGVITAPTAVTVSAPVSAADGVRSVVTGLPVQAGSVLTSPAVVAEVAGRPVITVESPGAFYRDLAFGDEGGDVSQLQQALGVRDTGVFDVATQDSLSALYETLGYAAPENDAPGTATEPDTIQPLADALEDAQANGDAALAAAELVLGEARAARDGGTGADAAVAQAQLQVDTARAARQRDIARAQRDLAAERERVRREELARGTRLDADEVVAVPFASTTVLDVSASPGLELQPGQEIVTLGDPTLRAITYVNMGEAQMLQPEMAVSITSSTLPAALTGTVVSVASEPSTVSGEAADPAAAAIGSTPSTERPYRVEVELAEQPPSSSVGTGVLLTVTVQGTGAAVVAVPVVALQRIDGADVVVTLPDRRRWEVEPGFTAEGWVELRSGAPPVGSLVETR
ncbi:UNVERIFIED_ORG: hypothetical protein E4P37_11375 [Bacillus sp. AZ43]